MADGSLGSTEYAQKALVRMRAGMRGHRHVGTIRRISISRL
jgi:hypothetical protein